MSENLREPHESAHLYRLLIAALFSTIVAMITGMLGHAAGLGLPESFLSGGAAFGPCMALCLTVLQAARPR